VDAASAPRPRHRQVGADHRQDPADELGRWHTVIRAGSQVIAELVSESLEQAYDGTCAWVNTHLGEHVGIGHLCHGQPLAALNLVAQERTLTPPPPGPRLRGSRRGPREVLPSP